MTSQRKSMGYGVLDENWVRGCLCSVLAQRVGVTRLQRMVWRKGSRQLRCGCINKQLLGRLALEAMSFIAEI